MDFLNQVMEQFSGPALSTLSQQLGADEGQTQAALSAALPVLMGAMSKVASHEQGAAALQQLVQQDDGSIMDNLMGFLGSKDNGMGPQLIESFLGSRQADVQSGISQASGLNMDQVGGLLQNIAPVVIGMLGRMNQGQVQQGQGGIDIGSLVSMFTQQSRGMGQQGGDSGIAGMVSSFLDRDGDGSAIDDVAGMLGGLLRR
jgi:hypothetical protein